MSVTQTKLQWCAMLAKLVSPMEPERAAKAFVDMLPLLPGDDDLYTRSALERAAKIERKTAVPGFADVDAALSAEWRERLPVRLRMGGDYFPTLPAPNSPDQRTPEEIAHVQAKVTALKAEMASARALQDEALGRHEAKIAPKYLTPLQLALNARACGAIIMPGSVRAQLLAQHDAGVAAQRAAG